MNALELKLSQLNPGLLSKFHETREEVELLLAKYSSNFPSYTDHSLKHTNQVFEIASEMLTEEEINNLNADEIYILSMACILHDIGMCIPEEKLLTTFKSNRYKIYAESNPSETKTENLIRDIHHELSYDFILEEQEDLKIPDKNYAKAIALVAKGHRKVSLDDVSNYPPKFFVKGGREFVCLPYLAAIIRLADELDITNIRTPKLLTKYYLPDNEISIREWKKHISTTQINYSEDQVIFKVECSDQNNYAALENQFEKIQEVALYAQKIIRNITNTDKRTFQLQVCKIKPEYTFIGFQPKGIKFSFNVQNVVKTFIGKDLYENELTALREVIQNAIDSCNYKRSTQPEIYKPKIIIEIKENLISISDNGLGMDEFVIENFFGKLGSSFYEVEEIKKEYEAIGQFGVGVFSYFLLCDYIDIQTKTEKGKALNFRIDKDPKSYFHFYENANQETSGTTINFNLNEYASYFYSSQDILEYIKKTFAYINIPLELKLKSENIKIEVKSPKCLKKETVKNILKISHRNKIDDLEIISFSLKNEKVEGECSLIVPKINSDHDLDYFKIDDYFYDDIEFHHYFADSFGIRIYQKGVYVKNHNLNFLNYAIGNINIKSKLALRLDRNGFSNDSDLNDLMHQFSAGLIQTFFNTLNQKTLNNKTSITRLFLSKYLDRFDFNFDMIPFKNIDMLSFKLYDKGDYKEISLQEILSTPDDFMIINSNEEEKIIFKHFKMPILILKELEDQPYGNCFESLTKILMFGLKINLNIIHMADSSYVSFNGDKSIFKNSVFELEEFNNWKLKGFANIQDNIICVNLTDNKNFSLLHNDYQYYLNKNHPFFKHIIECYDTFNSIQLRAISEIIESIINLTRMSKSRRKAQIPEINKLSNELFQGVSPYIFSQKDFK